ncbi:hypothetical protein PMZ80_002576 [Knufia obscura]|uniref:BTB domain-containing protein n=1 Tax=Knufia obscura TaxID=1635080 RepID=A0ABR0RXP7_9EURO|nr:hypothetical protein PMZ80_002576 [Knufia obscura]
MKSPWVDFSSTITIVVTNTGTEFVVHKHVACKKSPFVKGAMKEHTQEAQEQKIEFADWDDDEAMRTIIAWMYQGRSVLCLPASHLDDLSAATQVDRLQSRLVKLYILADRMMMAQLKNNIVDWFHSISRQHYMSSDAMRILFETGPSECHLKTFAVWDMTQQLDYKLRGGDNVTDELELRRTQPFDIPVVAHAVLQMLLHGQPEWTDICAFHEHEKNEDRSKCEADSSWVRAEDDEVMLDGSVDASEETGNH